MGNKKWTSILLCGERGIQEGIGGFIIVCFDEELGGTSIFGSPTVKCNILKQN